MQAESVRTLNDLIETLIDGKNGFASAADGVKDPEIKSVFTELSGQRARFAAELQTKVASLGAEPEQNGSTAAAMHRGWINLKSALGGGTKAILNEAERGEDMAVQAFRKAESADLEPNLATIVHRQAADIQAAHDRIKQLRDSAN